MSLIKKVDVPEHFAARRAMRLRIDRPAIVSPALRVAGVAPCVANAIAGGFVQDFLLEHSSSTMAFPPKA